MKVWASCALCGFEAESSLAFSRHIDEHNGSRHPDEWYVAYRARGQNAQWGDSDAVMLHVTHDPTVPDDRKIRYVGRHDAKLKAGYERVYLRNLQEVNKFEREHKVMNHVMHYDSNGKDITDYQGSH
jgi:hypothetical protein